MALRDDRPETGSLHGAQPRTEPEAVAPLGGYGGIGVNALLGHGPATLDVACVGAHEFDVPNHRSLAHRLRSEAGGMLSEAVYERLYGEAGACGGGNLVEIGTAQGAATIALALGARASGKPFRIFTADPFDRGSRLEVGSVAQNLELVRDGFASFGVADVIHVIVGGSANVLNALDGEISLLLIDADGQVDRDIFLLFDRLARDGIVIIDDIDNRVHLLPSATGVMLDQKHRLSHLLTTRMCEMGLLLETDRLGQTAFYRKGSASLDRDQFIEASLQSYRQLIWAHIDDGQLARGTRWISRWATTFRAARNSFFKALRRG